MLCISSTSIIFKVFEENRLKSRHFAQLVMGVLIVEDLVAILLLVLLSTVALTREVSGVELLWSAGRLVFFLTLWFAIGLFMLPAIIRRIRRLLTEETTLIFSVGLCLLMVLIATTAGFSPALGAFVMGSLLAETAEGSRIEKLLHPLRNFFAAIFFVSVGMLFDLTALTTTWHLVLLMSVVLIVGKTVAVTIGAMLSGQSLNTSLKAGLSLTQIGEFSFIIAGLGLSLNVIGPTLYPMAVGVSILTSFTTPYLIRYRDVIVEVVERMVPRAVHEKLTYYQTAVQRQKGTRLIPVLIRAYVPLMAVNLVLLLSTTWVMRHVVYPQFAQLFDSSPWVRAASLTLDLLVCLPFFYGLCFRRPHVRWRAELEKFPRSRWAQAAATVFRVLLGFVVALLVVAQYVSFKTFSSITILVFAGLAFVVYRYGGFIYRDLEGRFLGQVGAKKADEAPQQLLPWDQHLSELEVGPDSPLVGMTLGQIGPQESFGVVVAAIDRGQRRLLAPKATDQVFPGDRLQVIGSDESVERIRRLAELTEPPIIDDMPLKLQSIVLSKDSPVCGRLLRESDIRGLVDGLVVGVEREGFRQLHPPADLRLEAGDRLWLVGDPDKIHLLNGEAK